MNVTPRYYTLSTAKRELIWKVKELLALCTEEQQNLFNRMYPKGIEDLDCNKLDWCIQQCERTIQKNRVARGENPSPFEPRDYEDFNRKDIAIYNFRGYTVLKFWKKDAPDGKKFALQWGKDANMCCFIPSDFKYMRDFLDKCYAFTQDETKDFDSTDVD